jgi:alpha-glucosidase
MVRFGARGGGLTPAQVRSMRRRSHVNPITSRGLAALLILVAAGLRAPVCPAAAATAAADSVLLRLSSPDGRLRAVIDLSGAMATGALDRDGAPLLLPSALGLDLADGGPLRDLRLEQATRRIIDETWRPAWGADAEVRDRANELRLDLREAREPRRRLALVLRAADDGFAFRYEIPARADTAGTGVLAEETTFHFAGDPRAWWIPADEFAYESLHRETPLSRVDRAATPLTMRTPGGAWVALHEAELLDWSEMWLERAADADTAGVTLQARLWPWPDGTAVKGRGVMRSPWRVLLVADSPGGLATSHLAQNLCAPSVIEDTSWIRPLTFCGVWWGLHTGQWTWAEGPRHGATTERTKECIDFAARHGLGGVLAEGWNPGWETWGHGESRQDYRRGAADFDLDEVARYARERGIAFIGHHETGGNIPMYEAQMDSAFALCERLGIRHVKTGYAGTITPAGMHHHGQYMVRHFQRVVETAARHRVALDVHEGIKPTGLDRTWPNLMSTEAIRGMEHNATLNTLPPRHATILPFTRFLAGPADYTPGIFSPDFAPGSGRRVIATVANQLALYIVFTSPLMMMADLPENAEAHPALRFLDRLPCTWDESRVVEAAIGDIAVFARRSGDAWYVGAVTDEQARALALPLAFLAPGQAWRAEVFADADAADWEHDPAAVETQVLRVTSADTLRAALSRAGGLAARLRPWATDDIATMTVTDFNLKSAPRLARFAALPVPGDNRVDHLGVGAVVTLAAPPSPRYDRGALTDGRVAGAGFQDDAWLGFEGVDLAATIDLGSPHQVREVALRALHDPGSWIQLPAAVVVESSRDGRSWSVAGRLAPPAGGERAEIRTLVVAIEGQETRFLRVTAIQRPLPDGHPGHGQPGWVFCDEVLVGGVPTP